MKNKKKLGKNTRDPRYAHLRTDESGAASATDSTGLIPSNPQTKDGREAYHDIQGTAGEPPKNE